MEPSAVIQVIGWVLALWLAVAAVLTVAVAAFLNAAHRNERRLPSDASGLRAWVRASRTSRPRHSRAA
jgi:hypothetical protein